MSLRAAIIGCTVGLFALSTAMATPAASPQRVVSLNLCTDQLLLLLADREQIASISWLGVDPEESAYAERAVGLPVNFGRAEEILPLKPDLVLAGSYTTTFTVGLLQRLGLSVLTLPPARTLEMLERHIEQVAVALGHPQRGRQLVDELNERRRTLEAAASQPPIASLVIHAGGSTVDEGLTDEILALAGLVNVARMLDLDRWGSPSVEMLLRTHPQVLVIPSYRRGQPSLAAAALRHPALERFADSRITVSVNSAKLGCETPALLDAADELAAAAREARW